MGLFGFGKKKNKVQPQKTEEKPVPPVQNYDYLKSYTDVTAKKQAFLKFQAEQMIQLAQQAAESLTIISKTSNPDTFFSRCQFFEKRVEQLEQLENQLGCSIPNCEAKTMKTFYDLHFQNYLNFLYSEYEDAAYNELQSDAAIKRRIDKFWDLAEKYLPAERTLREITPSFYNEEIERAKEQEARATSDRYWEEWEQELSLFDPYKIEAFDDEDLSFTSVELNFLKYMNKKNVIDPAVAQYWRIEYRIDFKALMTEFITHRYLRISSPYDVLPKLKVDELRKILEEQGLEKKGTKAVLIERIKDSLPEDAISHLQPNDKAFYVLTEKGIHATEDLKTSATKDIDMEDFCINEILNGNFDEAYRRICEWEASKLIFRGVGIDWNHELKYGLSKTKAVTYRNFFEADLDELPDALKYHENIFKACVILGDILGVSIDKTYSLFRRLSDTEEEKYIIIEQLQNYSLNLQSYKPHTVSYWD